MKHISPQAPQSTARDSVGPVLIGQVVCHALQRCGSPTAPTLHISEIWSSTQQVLGQASLERSSWPAYLEIVLWLSIQPLARLEIDLHVSENFHIRSAMALCLAAPCVLRPLRLRACSCRFNSRARWHGAEHQCHFDQRQCNSCGGP